MTENNLSRTALNKAMAMCASREYCSDDIRFKLESWGLRNPELESVLDTLIKENFIDDKRFAAAFVKDRYRNNKWGRVKIAAHLRAKRVSSEIIESALAELDEESYRKDIKGILESHRKYIKAKNQYDLKGKLLRFGLSRGFESNILYDILNEIL